MSVYAPIGTAGSGFTFAEDKTPAKAIYTVYGGKGEGKTAYALSFPGTIHAVTFDHKTTRVRDLLYGGDPRIVVLNGTAHYSHKKAEMTVTGAKSVQYLLWLMGEIGRRGGTDWMLIDGTEIMIEICEMAMRHDAKLTPFQGFKELTLWKDRKANLRAIHDAAVAVARKGVIYTTYTDKLEIVEDGKLLRVKEVPKYWDIIMLETDVVVHTERHIINGEEHYLATVVSSKLESPRTSEVIDFTIGKKRLPNPKPSPAAAAVPQGALRADGGGWVKETTTPPPQPVNAPSGVWKPL